VTLPRENLTPALQRIRARKVCLLVLLAVTCLAPLPFVSLDEPTASLRLYKLLAKTGSLVGTVLMVWQMLLGYRVLVGRWLQDLLWTLALHRRLGQLALPLILLHPVFITAYYAEKFDLHLFTVRPDTRLGAYLVVGWAALFVLAAIVVTSLLRRRLHYRWWYAVHVTSYVMVLAAVVHALAIGSTVGGSVLRYVWMVLGGLLILLGALRLLLWLGLGADRFTVSAVRPVADDTTEVTLTPARPCDRLQPRVGQFVYLRPAPSCCARPFTVSRYDAATGAVSVTVKAFGVTSRRVQHLAVGDPVRLDGPYGVFGLEALESSRPVVLLAGGIGITPFLRLAEHLVRDARRQTALFYGAATRSAMAYADELAALPGLTFVPLLADEPSPDGPTDRITVGLLERHLGGRLADHEFLLCGPPGMVRALERSLHAAGVPRRQIHHELFTF